MSTPTSAGPGTGLGTGTRVGYAVGSLGTGGFGTVPGLLVAYYLTDTLGVPAALGLLVVIVPKVWDVVIDPYVGRRSDTSALARGSRRPFMLVGALTLPVAFALMFAADDQWGRWAAAGWVLVAYVAAATCFSVFQVPYLAMAAEITDRQDERTRLMAWRVAVLALAILLFGAGAPEIRDAAGGGVTGYRTMGVVIGAMLAVGLVGAWWGTRRVRPVPPATGSRDVRLADELRAVAADRAFLRLLGAFVLQAVATGVMLAVAQYVATYVLDREGLVTALFVCLVAPAVLVTPLWVRVSARTGPLGGFRVASLLFAAGTLPLTLAAVLPVPAVLALVGLVGAAYAGLQVFPLALLPTVAAHAAARTGEPRVGVYTGVWTAGETAGLALGPAVVLGVLALSGFVSTGADEVTAQPTGVTVGILACFGVIPVLLVGLSLLLLRRDVVPGDVVPAPPTGGPR